MYRDIQWQSSCAEALNMPSERIEARAGTGGLTQQGVLRIQLPQNCQATRTSLNALEHDVAGLKVATL